MANTKKLRRSVIFTAIISLISFLYKLFLGIFSSSLVLMVASLSSLLVFLAKFTFIKNATKSREEKRKAYLIIAIVTLFYSVAFILFSILKVNGIDTSNKKTYEGLYGAIFIGVLFVMFTLSLIKLRSALQKTDILVIGLKEIIFVSALTDLVIIEECVSRVILQYNDIPYMNEINSYFALGISILMLIIPIIMFVRYAKYKPNQK